MSIIIDNNKNLLNYEIITDNLRLTWYIRDNRNNLVNHVAALAAIIIIARTKHKKVIIILLKLLKEY